VKCDKIVERIPILGINADRIQQRIHRCPGTRFAAGPPGATAQHVGHVGEVARLDVVRHEPHGLVELRLRDPRRVCLVGTEQDHGAEQCVPQGVRGRARIAGQLAISRQRLARIFNQARCRDSLGKISRLLCDAQLQVADDGVEEMQFRQPISPLNPHGRSTPAARRTAKPPGPSLP
jgi:hypothetical protein